MNCYLTVLSSADGVPTGAHGKLLNLNQQVQVAAGSSLPVFGQCPRKGSDDPGRLSVPSNLRTALILP